jgi:hypothetical protein
LLARPSYASNAQAALPDTANVPQGMAKVTVWHAGRFLSIGVQLDIIDAVTVPVPAVDTERR